MANRRRFGAAAAGTLIGLAIGGLIALVIAMKPEIFAGLAP